MENAIEKLKVKEIKEYNIDEASLDAICFIGTPFRNTGLKNKLLLSSSLHLKNNIFFEFDVKDIIKIEEIDKIVDNQGNSIPVIKIWVKKGSKALKHEPFIVE